MRCLQCNKTIKGDERKKFCTNKGRNNCKDKYHNRGRPLSDARIKYLGFRNQEELDEHNINQYDGTATIEACENCGYIDCDC